MCLTEKQQEEEQEEIFNCWNNTHGTGLQPRNKHLFPGADWLAGWNAEFLPEHPVAAIIKKNIKEEEEEEEREYTIETQVVGMGYMSFYDEEDMRNQIVYCSNGCWKLKGDKTSRDLNGDLCITDDEEEEE